MQFHRFVGKDMAQALAAAKAALGPEAMVVAIDQHPGRGFWRQPKVEVTATLGQVSPAANGAAPQNSPPPPAGSAAVPPNKAEPGQNLLVESLASNLRDADDPAPPEEHRAPKDAEEPRRSKFVQLEQELAAAREALRHNNTALAALGRLQGGDAPATADSLFPSQLTEEFDHIKRMLSGIRLGGLSLGQAQQCADRSILDAADVDPEVAEALVRDLEQHPPTTEGDDTQHMVPRLKDAIACALPTVGDFFAQQHARRIALVGPTGVGKTTTVAKIAAHAALKHGLRVALVGLDSYRIGASEQLGQYARLIGVPMQTAYDRASLAGALAKFAGYDLVLIDTAGRGPNQAGAHCLQLRELFAQHDVEIYITLAAATRRLEREEMLAAMGDLTPLNARALVLTKLDEAVALGSALSLTYATGLPLAFVTSGQRVPEDLCPADAAELADRMVERVLGSRSRRVQAPTRKRPHRYAPSLALAHGASP